MAHHFIFQRYLQYFSPDVGNIFRYDKNINEEKLLPIKKVGAINDYYTYIQESGEKDTSFENPFLSNFEGLYPVLITSLEKQEPLSSHYDYLTSIMAIMHSRVPKQRNHITSVVKDLHRKTKSLGEPSKNLDLELMVENMKLYANIMSHSYFWIGVIQDDSTFITSDNPAGNACLPLTPKLCLFSSSEKKSVEYVPVDKEVVEKINWITYTNADKYIFGHASIKPLFERKNQNTNKK